MSWGIPLVDVCCRLARNLHALGLDVLGRAMWHALQRRVTTVLLLLLLQLLPLAVTAHVCCSFALRLRQGRKRRLRVVLAVHGRRTGTVGGVGLPVDRRQLRVDELGTDKDDDDAQRAPLAPRGCGRAAFNPRPGEAPMDGGRVDPRRGDQEEMDGRRDEAVFRSRMH